MAAGILVTPEQLVELAGRVNGGAQNIGGELAGLAASLAPLGSDWAGQAQGAFQELWAEWRRAADSLQHALTGISDLLNRAGGAYSSAEQQIAASFARM